MVMSAKGAPTDRGSVGCRDREAGAGRPRPFHLGHPLGPSPHRIAPA